MSKRKERTLGQDWDAVSKQLARGKGPTLVPENLPLKSIKLWPGLFQHRSLRGHAGEAHVRTLTASLRKSRLRILDPVTVWWDGRAWACIDGHHRLDAYVAAQVGGDHAVPVVVFEGTISQAMGGAASGNTKEKLPMSSAEKSNTAWRLVAASNGLSKAQIAQVANVSETTVANMRRTLDQLQAVQDAVDPLEGGQSVDLRDLSWPEAKRLSEGGEAADFDREEANEKQAQAMALGLRKVLGKQGAKYPEVLARALEIYDSRLMDRLVDWWGTQDDEDEVEVEPEGAAQGF